MRRQMMRMAAMVLYVTVLGGLSATPARAQVHVNVNIGPPAPVIVQAPPPMLFLSDPGVYVAVGVPYDIFFMNGRYYYSYGDNWFWGPGYGGPWTYVGYSTLPPGLRKFKVGQLREYREREYRVYRVQGRNFRGEHFYAEEDGQGENGHGNGNGNGHHKKGKNH